MIPREEEKSFTIPLAPMGVLAPGLAQARPSARPPIETSGNFLNVFLIDFLAKSDNS